jgi:hypothetical protein
MGGGGGRGFFMWLPVKYQQLVSVFIEASKELKGIFQDN